MCVPPRRSGCLKAVRLPAVLCGNASLCSQSSLLLSLLQAGASVTFLLPPGLRAGGFLEKGPWKGGRGGFRELLCESTEELQTPAPSPRVSPELQHFYNNQSRLPDSRVVLCFGEEFPDMTPLRSKLILVQVRAAASGLVARSPSPHVRSQFIPGLHSRRQGLGYSTCVQKQAWVGPSSGSSGFLPVLNHLMFQDSHNLSPLPIFGLVCFSK